MKTTLHYQVKDFKRFVLENLEKRGYVLAAGTEPMLAVMDDLDDPEMVVLEVLVEDRQPELEAVNSQALVAPQTLTLLGPVGEQPAPKVTRTVTEKEAARREAISKRMKEINASKMGGKRTSPNDQVALAERQAERQRVVDQRLAAAQEQIQEVVAPTTTPFRTSDLFREAEGLLNGSAH